MSTLPVSLTTLLQIGTTQSPPPPPALTMLPQSPNAPPTDALAMLFSLLSQEGLTVAQTGEQNVDTARADNAAKLQAAQQAYEKMKQAQSDPFGWLGDIFKVVVVAASAVASCVSGGAASPILAASASAFGTVVQQTQCFGDVSNVVGALANVGGSIGTGNLILVGGDSLNLTGAIGGATKSMDSDVVTGFTLAGAGTKAVGALAMMAGNSSAPLAEVARDAQVGGGIGLGIYDVDRTVRDGEAAQDAIDMTRAQQQIKLASDTIESLIEAIGDNHDSNNHAKQSLEGAIQTQGQTSVLAAQGIRG